VCVYVYVCVCVDTYTFTYICVCVCVCAIAGSAGGGHERAVMWNEMNGITKLSNGKLYFVLGQAQLENEQAARGGQGLWDFALQVISFVVRLHMYTLLDRGV